jgi:hypothetical protein
MRLVGALVVVLLAAGCGGKDHDVPAVSAAPSASASPVASPVDDPPGSVASAVDDPPGSVACTRLAAAVAAGSLMEPHVVDDIAAASRTADAPLADAAERLATAYGSAVAAAGKADEPDKIAAVAAAASDMSGVCGESGLRTAG